MADVFPSWAVLELLGHRRLGGHVQEVEVAGAKMLRIDIPGDIHTTPEGQQTEVNAATQYYSPQAVYAITPCTEQIAREVAARSYDRPHRTLGLPRPMAPEEDAFVASVLSGEAADIDDDEGGLF